MRMPAAGRARRIEDAAAALSSLPSSRALRWLRRRVLGAGTPQRPWRALCGVRPGACGVLTSRPPLRALRWLREACPRRRKTVGGCGSKRPLEQGEDLIAQPGERGMTDELAAAADARQVDVELRDDLAGPGGHDH